MSIHTLDDYSKCTSIGQLMSCLMQEYGIKPRKKPAEDELTKTKGLLAAKNRECQSMTNKLALMEQLTHRLTEQLKLSEEQHRKDEEKHSQQMSFLREKVSIFERTLQEEQHFVSKLKDMLSGKEMQVKQLVSDYEVRIEQLQKKLEASGQEISGSSQSRQLKSEIHNLNGLLREQERVMVELLHRNNRLEETVLQLQRRQLLSDSRDSAPHNELDDSDLS